jgi:hypothetical protein
MIEHLSGPFSAGAVDSRVTPGPGGRLTVDWLTREPVLLVAPKASLGGNLAWRLEPVLDPDGTAAALTPLEFVPWTEADAFLPLYRPPANPETHVAAPFTIALRLNLVAADGAVTPVPVAEIADRIELRLIEGVMGRMIYLLGAEKHRLRRLGRLLAAMRLLEFARGDGLDRTGAELGVARFSEQISVVANQIVTATRTEPDPEYRRRLRLYRPWLLPTRGRVLELLNGPGDDVDPNRSALGEMGLRERFRLREEDNEFAVAIHLVATAAPLRDNFLQYIRRTHLVHPEDTPAANTVHLEHYLPSRQKGQVNQLRTRLRERFSWVGGAAVASMLATALDRVARCRTALGEAAPWKVLRAQDSGGGSRYELGLGVDIAAPAAAELDRMADRLRQAERPPGEPDISALLGTMTPRSAAQDPEGRWLLEPCGLRTVHRLGGNRVYLSHLPTSGMAITGPSVAAVDNQADLEVRYHAPGDPGKNLVLDAGLRGAEAAWLAEGGPAWARIPDAQAHARWQAAGPRPANDPGLGIIKAAGLPALENPAPVVERLRRLPEELVETIRLANPHALRITAGQPAAADELRRLAGHLRAQGLSSVLPLIIGPAEVLLMVGVIGLPEAGINLSERRAAGFRWYVVPIQGPEGRIKVLGSRTTLVPGDTGLSAVVAIGYARRGGTDPYEFRVELPESARLNLVQYEFLMNVLDHAHPMGIEVNTFSIRKQHVDLDGDGRPEPLPTAIARTFRPFRRRRQRGEQSFGAEDVQ